MVSPPEPPAPRAPQGPARTLRQAVLATVLPAPEPPALGAPSRGGAAPSPAQLSEAAQPRLPGLDELDLDATDFWERFRDAAPLHLRAAFAVGVWAIGSLLPRLTGSWRSLRTLPPARRDAVVQRADRWPVFRDLLDVVKLVAAMAYFRDPRIQARFRGPR